VKKFPREIAVDKKTGKGLVIQQGCNPAYECIRRFLLLSLPSVNFGEQNGEHWFLTHVKIT
jgi:hypothetical protein